MRMNKCHIPVLTIGYPIVSVNGIPKIDSTTDTTDEHRLKTNSIF